MNKRFVLPAILLFVVVSVIFAQNELEPASFLPIVQQDKAYGASPTPQPPSPTATSTPLLTATFTATSTPTNTSTITLTPTQTATGTNTPTATSSPTSTPTNTATVTPTPVNTPTETPTSTPTTTPSPTNTSTPTMTPTPSPTPTATVPPGVHIRNNHSAFESSSFLHIVGEITNNTSQPIWLVNVDVNIFDGDGSLLTTDLAFVGLDVLNPGVTACFDALVIDDYEGWETYEFEPVEYFEDPPSLPNISVFNTSTSTTSLDWLKIIGQVRNEEDEDVENVFLHATVYDENGTVLDCDLGIANTTDLSSGQTSAFDMFLTSRDNYDDVDSYRLQADADFVN